MAKEAVFGKEPPRHGRRSPQVCVKAGPDWTDCEPSYPAGRPRNLTTTASGQHVFYFPDKGEIGRRRELVPDLCQQYADVADLDHPGRPKNSKLRGINGGRRTDSVPRISRSTCSRWAAPDVSKPQGFERGLDKHAVGNRLVNSPFLTALHPDSKAPWSLPQPGARRIARSDKAPERDGPYWGGAIT